MTYQNVICLSSSPRPDGSPYPNRNPLPDTVTDMQTPSVDERAEGDAIVEVCCSLIQGDTETNSGCRHTRWNSREAARRCGDISSDGSRRTGIGLLRTMPMTGRWRSCVVRKSSRSVGVGGCGHLMGGTSSRFMVKCLGCDVSICLHSNILSGRYLVHHVLMRSAMAKVLPLAHADVQHEFERH